MTKFMIPINYRIASRAKAKGSLKKSEKVPNFRTHPPTP